MIRGPIRTSKIVCRGSTCPAAKNIQCLAGQGLGKHRGVATKETSQNQNQPDDDRERPPAGRPGRKCGEGFVGLAPRFSVSEVLPRFVMRFAGGLFRWQGSLLGRGRLRRGSASEWPFALQRIARQGRLRLLGRPNRLQVATKSSMAATVGKHSERLMGIPFPATGMQRSAKKVGATISAMRTQKLSLRTRTSPRATSRPFTRTSTGSPASLFRGTTNPSLNWSASSTKSSVRPSSIRTSSSTSCRGNQTDSVAGQN